MVIVGISPMPIPRGSRCRAGRTVRVRPQDCPFDSRCDRERQRAAPVDVPMDCSDDLSLAGVGMVEIVEAGDGLTGVVSDPIEHPDDLCRAVSTPKSETLLVASGLLRIGQHTSVSATRSPASRSTIANRIATGRTEATDSSTSRSGGLDRRAPTLHNVPEHRLALDHADAGLRVRRQGP